MSDAYARAGVDIDAGNETISRYRALLTAGSDARVIGGIGGFGGCFALGGYREPVLVASTDGVGTKALIAAALGGYQDIGRDLVHHCINDIACLNAQPLFFLDYLAVGKLNPETAASVVGGIARACHEYGLALLGGETAEMPDVYKDWHFDLAGTIVGAVEREAMLDPSAARPGDAIIGLPANGFHTNGYTLVRKVFPPERWSEQVAGGNGSVGAALLAVHPCYLAYVRAVQNAGISIKAMAHITGGGLIDNLPRMFGANVGARLQSERWHVPPAMQQAVRELGLDPAQSYRTFNMGIGFCIAVSGADSDAALKAVNESLSVTPVCGAEIERAGVIGKVQARRRGAAAIVIE